MILQYMLKVMFVDNIDSGVNFCGTFFRGNFFLQIMKKAQKLEPAKILIRHKCHTVTYYIELHKVSLLSIS